MTDLTRHEIADFSDTMDRHGINVALHVSDGLDVAAAALVCMISNWQDAMMSTNLPDNKDQQARDEVEVLFRELKLRDYDEGYAEANLHFVAILNEDDEEDGFGVDSLEKKVYDLEGKQTAAYSTIEELRNLLALRILAF